MHHEESYCGFVLYHTILFPFSFACSIQQTMAVLNKVYWANGLCEYLVVRLVLYRYGCFVDVHEWSIWCTELYTMPHLHWAPHQSHQCCVHSVTAVLHCDSTFLCAHYHSCSSLFSFEATCEALSGFHAPPLPSQLAFSLQLDFFLSPHRQLPSFSSSLSWGRAHHRSVCVHCSLLSALVCSLSICSFSHSVCMCVCVGMGKQTQQNVISLNQLADEVRWCWRRWKKSRLTPRHQGKHWEFSRQTLAASNLLILLHTDRLAITWMTLWSLESRWHGCKLHFLLHSTFSPLGDFIWPITKTDVNCN